MAIALPTPSRSGLPPVATASASSDRRTEPREGMALYLVMAGVATVGLTGWRVGNFTVSDGIFTMAAGVIVVYLLGGARSRLAPRRARQTPPALVVGVALMTLGGLLATFLRSLDPFGSALVLVRIWYLTIVWFWMIRSVSTSLRAFQRVLIAALVGVTLHAGVAIVQEVTGANAVAPTWGRSRGFSDHFNDLGVSIGSLVPLIVAWPSGRGRRSEVVRWGALLVMLGGLSATGSLTQMAASLVGVLTVFGLRRAVGVRRSSRRRLAVPVLAAVLAVIVVSSGMVELAFFDRFTGLTASSSAERYSASTRVGMSRVAIDGAVASPLVGVGLDERSGAAANDYADSLLFRGNEGSQIHSVYLRLLFEAGVLALLGLLVVLFVVFRAGLLLLVLLRRTSIAWLPNGLLGCLVAVCLGSAFMPILFGRTLWLPAALLSAFWGMAKAGLLDEHLAAAQAPPDSPDRAAIEARRLAVGR